METKVVYYWLITKNLTNNKLLYLGKEFRILYNRQNIFFYQVIVFRIYYFVKQLQQPFLFI